MTIMRATVWCLAAALLAGPAGAAPTDWVLGYAGESTNAFVGDQRTRALVNSRVPAALAGDVLAGLGGPPDPVFVAAGRYLSASACVPHDCPDSGFFWIDSRTGVGLGARFGAGAALRIGSNGLTPATLPAPARQALIDWLDDRRIVPASVAFVGPDNRPLPLAAADFTPPARFQPPAGGPSFDCARAATAIEKTICADPGLSRQDLELAALVQKMRHGYDTIAARDQLTALQRGWLRARDAACAQGPDRVACLGGQYRHQHDVLWNWLPGR